MNPSKSERKDCYYAMMYILIHTHAIRLETGTRAYELAARNIDGT